MEFKSQICTTKEQSEKLLTLGLKKETADMSYYILDDGLFLMVGIAPAFREIIKGGKVVRKQNLEIIPAWSLHGLMEIAYNGDILGCVALNFHERNIGAYYEQVIKVIEYLIRVKEFNKDYLEERK